MFLWLLQNMKTDKIPRVSALNTHALVFLLLSITPCSTEYEIPDYEIVSAKQSSVFYNIGLTVKFMEKNFFY